MTSIKLLTIGLSFLIFLLVVELIRREKLTFKYAFGWLLISSFGFVLTIFDTTLFRIARFFGFELTSNFIFFTILSVFIFWALLMSVFLCQQNSRNDRIVQQLGLLQTEVDRLKKERKESQEK